MKSPAPQPKESGSTRLIKTQQYLFHKNQGPQNKRSKPWVKRPSRLPWEEFHAAAKRTYFGHWECETALVCSLQQELCVHTASSAALASP